MFQNKEMWLYIVALSLDFLSFIPSADRNWIMPGRLGLLREQLPMVVVTAMGKYCIGRKHLLWSADHRKYCGSVAGLVLELFLFSVDYARSERLYLKTMKYYYYVKAIPRLP